MERSDGATPPLSPELESVDGDGGIGALMLMPGRRASCSDVQVGLCLDKAKYQKTEDSSEQQRQRQTLTE
jgi:hypothetical protein